MPRTPHKGPLGFGESAHAVMEQVIARADPDAVETEANPDAEPEAPHVAAGRKGGKARGKALSAAKRTAIAQTAAANCWAEEHA